VPAAEDGQVVPLPLTRKAALAAEILLCFARARLALRRGDLPGTLALLRAPRGGRAGDGDGHVTALALGRPVARTLSVLPADSRCLMTSLVLVALLARRGISSRLVIGVLSGSEFGAHAWVEIDGRAVLPPGDGAFERLVEL
jgi:hypothetical protein